MLRMKGVFLYRISVYLIVKSSSTNNIVVDIQDAQKYIEEFAQQGLRTLCIATRNISDEEYESWQEHYQTAVTAMEHRAVCE